MTKRIDSFPTFGRRLALFLVFLVVAGCGGSDSQQAAAPGDPDPKFSLPLPKGLWAPLPDSDLVMTARAVIDPGTAGERTVDLTVDLSTNRVTGVIDGVSAGPHTVEIRYFINQVQVAAVTLSVDVVPGQNNPVQIAPAAIRYIEAVSDTLFVADAADLAIQIVDHYSDLPGGRVQAAPTRILKPTGAGISEPSPGGLFVDTIGGGLYVANTQAHSVAIWNNAAIVDGIVQPDRLLMGDATRLNQPSGVAVDPFRNLLYVVNKNGEILIWNGAASLTGEVSPSAVIAGPLTELTGADHPLYLDVKSDTLYIANGSHILLFEKLSRLTGNQEVAPVRKIQIASKNLLQAGVAVDPNQNLFFVSSRDANGTIYRIPEISSAQGEVPPAATLADVHTGLNQTSALALAGNVLMALNAGETEIRVWHQADQKNGDASPTQILEWSSPATPVALFYVATQNIQQADTPLDVQKSGNGNVTSDLPGINCGTTCSAFFPAGSEVTLIATAEGNDTFIGWSDPCSGTGVCTVNMDAAKAVTASFSFTLSVNKTGTGSGLVTSSPGIQCGNDCSEPYPFGTQVTLSATADPSSDFTGWTGPCSGTGACVVTVDAAKSVTATFTLKPFTLAVTRTGTGSGTVTSNPSGINCGTDCSEAYSPGSTVTLTATPDANSNFTGWSGPCTGTGNCIVTIDAAKSVTAGFDLKPVLTVTRSGTGTGTVTGTGINCGTDCTQPYNNSTTQVTLTAAAAASSDFTGWSGCDSATGSSCTVTMNAAKTVTAMFTLKTFSLTLTKAGTGTGVASSSPAGIDCGSDCSETYTFGASVTLTATPSADSNFTGWSGACTGTGSCVVTVDAAKTVMATFTLKTFVLTVAKSGSGSGTIASSPAGINCGTDCSEAYNINTLVFVTATPSSGSEFSGWSGACSGAAATCSVTMDAAKNVTANFIRNFPLTVSKSGTGAGVVASTPGGIDCGADCSETYVINTSVTLTATPDANSTFTGWSGGCTGTGTCVVTMDAAKTVTATFNLRSLGLSVAKAGNGNGTVASNPGGISCGTDCSELYDINTQVSLTATPAVDSTFTGWTGACTGTGTCTVTIDAAKTVTATFTLRTFTLTVTKSGVGDGTVTSSPAGINCGTGCTQSYNAGTQVTLTANPDGTSNFAGWSGCVGSANSCVVTMDAARTVTASFAPKPVLTVTKGGAGTGTVTGTGINCGTDCSESYDNFTTQVTLTAAPAADSTFTGWSGACTGTGNCVVTMNAAKTVTATFALQTFSLTVTKTGTGGGTVSSSPAGINCGTDCTQAYDAHTQVTLTASANGTSIFTGWSGACTVVTGNCVVTMDAARTVTASFTLRPVLTVAKTGTGTGTVTGTGINCGTDCTQSYTNFTTQVTLTANASADSDFTGWSGACSGTGSCVVTMDAAKTVTATFTLKNFALTVTKTGNGTVTSSPSGINCGNACQANFNSGTVVTLTAAPVAGSTFGGWSGDPDCTDGSVTMNGNKSCTATFTLNQHTLTIITAGNGAGTVSGAGTYDFGTTATVTATANQGSTFAGWSGPNGTECATGSVTMDANKSCTATFTLQSLQVAITKAGNGSGTVTSSPAGIDCGATCQANYNFGTVVTLTAAATNGSTFAGWSGDADCTDGSVTVNAARNCTATFTLNQHTLTISLSGNGTGVVTGAGTYNFGASAPVTATAELGSSFSGWSGPNGAECAAGSVTMDADKNCTATFTLDLETFLLLVTLDPAGTGRGEVTSDRPPRINCGRSPNQNQCSRSYPAGTFVTLTAEADLLSRFTGWNGDCAGTNPTCELNMISNQLVQARFDLLP